MNSFHKFDIEVKAIPLEDHPDYELDVEKEIEPCLKFIHDGLTREQPVGTLVICTAGVSRSATVCIAYLMKYHSMSLKTALKTVK